MNLQGELRRVYAVTVIVLAVLAVLVWIMAMPLHAD
jgi:hypothetical protein